MARTKTNTQNDTKHVKHYDLYDVCGEEISSSC